MASNYTPLGVQLMTTGEKAGTWGTLTNTNWDIIEQISGGYCTQAVTDGADTALGTPEANNIELIDLTGFGITTTLNSSGITVADMAVGLSTLSAISSSVGAISPADVMGLTGLSFNVNLGSTGVAPLGYKDIDITGNSSYTYVEHSA